MAPSPSTLKWRVLAGYFLSYMFDAVDILILAIAMPAISASLQIGPMQAGLLATATLLGIGMSGLVMGPLADRWGRRKVLLLSLGSFGALTMAVAAATDWREVLALRFLSGLGLGSVWGIAAAHVNETWPAHQRAGHFLRAQFLFHRRGHRRRGSLLPAARPWLARAVLRLWRGGRDRHGLRLALRARIRDLAGRPPAQRAGAPQGAGGQGVAPLFAPALLRVTLLGTLVSALTLAAYWGASTWLPTFLQKERGLETGTMARFLVLLNIGMFVGYNAFGYIADRVGKKRP